MSSGTVELELPQDWDRFQTPSALKSRLSDRLDQQDQFGSLGPGECDEALALTELSEILSLMKLRAERKPQ